MSWDCGVVAAEDGVVKIPSSSRERRGKDAGSAEEEEEGKRAGQTNVKLIFVNINQHLWTYALHIRKATFQMC